MTDFSFRDQLETNVFSRSNTYYIPNAVQSDVAVYNKRMYPLIMYGVSPVEREDGILYTDNRQFQGRMLSGPKIIEIAHTARVMIPVVLSEMTFYVGKGCIMYKPAMQPFIPLYVCTVPSDSYTANVLEDVTALVHQDYAAHHAIIKTVIQQLMKEHKGDIYFTKDIKKFVTGKLTFPRFPTIQIQKEYILSFVEKCYESL